MIACLMLAVLLQSPAEPLAEQALAAAQSGNSAEAARLWQQAIAKDSRHFASLFNLGVLLHRQKRQAEAVDLLERAAAIQPGYQVHFIRGSNFQQLGRREEAIRAWKSALLHEPKNIKLMQVLSVEYSSGRYFHEAAAIARRALRLAPGEANLYFLALKAYQDAGDPASAAELAAAAATRFPQSARAQFEHGYYLQKSGQTEAGITYLRRAMELDSNYEEPFFFYGDLLVKQSQWEDALAPLRKSIAIRPEYSPARVALARALSNLNQLPAAVKELELAVTLDPRNAQPWVMLAQLYFRMGDEDRARTAKETSLRLRHENPGVLEAAQARPFPANP
jgi:tetratricopeptide (TPR) repeat protein